MEEALAFSPAASPTERMPKSVRFLYYESRTCNNLSVNQQIVYNHFCRFYIYYCCDFGTFKLFYDIF